MVHNLNTSYGRRGEPGSEGPALGNPFYIMNKPVDSRMDIMGSSSFGGE